MAELPKFARERLRQGGAGETHPDANLLSAFVENALTPRERVQVLEHLSRCDVCRATAGYAQPAPEAERLTIAASAERRWARWTILRWGTLAASAVVIAIAVLVLRPHEKRATDKYFPPMTEKAATQAAPLPEISAESGGKPAEQARAEAPAKLAAPKRRVGKDQDKAVTHVYDGAIVAARQAPAVAQPAMTAASKMQARDSVATEQQPRSRSDQQFAYANQAPSQANQAQVANQVVTNQAQVANQTQTANQAPLANQAPVQNQVQVAQQKQNAGFVPSAPPPPQAAPQLSAANRIPAAVETVEVTDAAEVKSKKEAVPTTRVVPGVGVVGTLARSEPAEGVALKRAPVRWTISPTGRITRTFDDRTWAEVPVGQGVIFRALSAHGADIWAGGSGGALFHSSDGGERWTRVRPSVAGTGLTADITRIEFTDPQHGVLLTAANQRWTTTDGGKTWSLD